MNQRPVRATRRGWRTAPRMAPAGTRMARGPRLPTTMSQAPRHDVHDRRQPTHGALELLPQHHVPEAPPGLGVGVVERWVHRRAQGQVGVDGYGGQGQDGQAAQDQAPALPQDARCHEQDEGGDARRQEQREGVVAQRQPVDEGRCDQPAPSPRVAAAVVLLPACQQHQDECRQEGVQRMRVGPRGEAPGDGRRHEHDAGQDAQRPASRGLHDTDGEEPGCAGHQQRREQVGPEGLVAEGLKDDRCQPGQQGVGRVAGGMGDAQHRPDGLELGRVPGAHVGHQGGHVEEQGDARHEGEGQQRATCNRAVVALRTAPRAHHPSVTPQ